MTKSSQEYIDETPIWSDGTALEKTPLTSMQWLIWILISGTKFLEGAVIFMAGIALPLISTEFHLSAVEKGFVSTACPLGILLGAFIFGDFADRVGRKIVFIAELFLYIVFLFVVALSPNLLVLLAGLLGLGLAIGCDHPVAHAMLSETMPSKARGWLIVGAKSCTSLGILASAAIGLTILNLSDSLSDWRWMYAILIAPTTLILVLSFGIPKSGQWLASKGKIEDAEKALRELLVRVPPYPSDINLASVANIKPQNKVGIARIFSKQYRRATILASVPWFLMDLSIFGIGIFTPIILTLALGTHNPHARNIAELIANDRMGVRGALLIDIFTVLGSFIAIYMITKWSRIKLQTIGLIVSGFGLLMATLSLGFDGNTKTILMVCGFILFNFMIHAGPLSTVYLISGEVYPIEIRGIGAGFSASFAKLGAVLASFLFPIYLKDIGLESLLCFLVFTCFLAAYVSWHFRIDTTDIDISKLDQ